jgi:hypothetical protein
LNSTVSAPFESTPHRAKKQRRTSNWCAKTVRFILP